MAASSRSFDYLESLPGTVFYKLYQQPATALAIFRRMLPDLGMLVATRWDDADKPSKMLRDGASLSQGSPSGYGSGDLG